VKTNKYQKETNKTAIYPMEIALEYLTLGLVGEAGEIANKVKKVLRDDKGIITLDRKQQIFDELGDVLWYVAQLCEELDFDLEDVMEANIQKLLSRQERGKLQGEGDVR
jgi:NTP pyrophosphatase (non-canonical NTP hydrolase)